MNERALQQWSLERWCNATTYSRDTFASPTYQPVFEIETAGLSSVLLHLRWRRWKYESQLEKESASTWQLADKPIGGLSVHMKRANLHVDHCMYGLGRDRGQNSCFS